MEEAKRIHFKSYSYLRKNGKDRYGDLNFPFQEGIKDHFESSFRCNLIIPKDTSRLWLPIKSEDEYLKIEKWIEMQGSILFLKNPLTSTIALDLNINPLTGEYTDIGLHEHEAKTNRSIESIEFLVNKSFDLIQRIHKYNMADSFISIPCNKNKDFDLPKEATSSLAKISGKENLSHAVTLLSSKASVKDVALEKKESIWRNANVQVDKTKLKDKRIILIDDKYQSGTTMIHIGQKLMESGAKEVLGLCFVKTLRDSDNL